MRKNNQSLAVAYRPQTFEEVCGQTVTVEILKKVIEKRSFKNCYLFAGDSGSGKTTLARIFANQINRGVGEPIEIDAASNNGVDDVRAIVEAASQRSLIGEYKIFIIDECHSITTQGWQAFLKGIEEPSPFTIFMFCTTEPNKLPVAILNRVQRYNITKIEAEIIKNRLMYICQQEGFTNYEGLCDLLSKTSHGCMRDAIMKLDQCADLSTDLSLNIVKPVLGVLSYEAMFNLTWALQDKDEAKVLQVINHLYNNGKELKNFIEIYLEFILDLTKYFLVNKIECTNIPNYLATEANPVVQQTLQFPNIKNWLNDLTDLLLKIKLETKYDSFYKSTIEAFLIRFCR
jgi:DNA polymerase-3 subunit gamma/tau